MTIFFSSLSSFFFFFFLLFPPFLNFTIIIKNDYYYYILLNTKEGKGGKENINRVSVGVRLNLNKLLISIISIIDNKNVAVM